MSVAGALPHNPGSARRWPVVAAVLAIAGLAGTSPARADCTVTGPTTISCTGTTTNYQPGTINGIAITIQSGASVVGGSGGTEAIFTTGATNSSVSNFGTINGPVSFVGGGNTFTNAGLFTITDPAANLLGHSISGDYIQTAAGTLVLRFDASSFRDQLLINNADITLAGKLILVPQAQIYTAPIAEQFVKTVGGAVSGTFGSVTSSSPFFSVSTAYTATAVTVTLTPLAFNAVAGLTQNQQAVANALTANFSGSVTGNAATLYSNLFAATSVSVFDQLSGAGTSAAQGTAFGANTAFMALFGPGGFLGDGGATGGPLGYAAAPEHPVARIIKLKPQDEIARRWQTWAGGFGVTRTVDGDAVVGSFANKQRGGGGAAGVVYRSDADLMLGVAIGAGQSHFSVDGLSTSGGLTAAHLGMHAAKRWGAFYATAAFAYARFDNDIKRSIAGIGTTENATGSFASDLLAGRLETGWRHELGRYALTPFAAVQYSGLWQRGYSETSTKTDGTPGILGLSYASQAVPSLPATLGAQIDSHFVLANGLNLAPYARLAWLHEFKPDSRIDASLISIPGAGFTVAGARTASDAAKIDTGFRLALNRQTAFRASVNSELAGRSRSFAGTGALQVSW